MNDPWDPAQYERFKDERAQPFRALLRMCEPVPGGRFVDLGCGTGETTRELHRALHARETVGVDRSASMLSRSGAFAGEGLRFERADLETYAGGTFDVVFSNAALHWIEDQAGILVRLAGMLERGGQLAVQVPANHDHPAYLAAAEVAREEPFRSALDGWERRSPVLAPERYATLLAGLGLADVSVRLEVFLHLLPDRDAVAEWHRGTLLTDYAQRLGTGFTAFLARYRELLHGRLPDSRPFLLTYKRILMHATRSRG